MSLAMVRLRQALSLVLLASPSYLSACDAIGNLVVDRGKDDPATASTKKKRKKKKRGKLDDSERDEPEGRPRNAFEPADDGRYPPPQGDVRIQPRVGAWIRYASKKPDGAQGHVTTHATLDQRDDRDFLIEVQTKGMVAQAWLGIGDMRRPEDIELLSLKARIGGGKVQTFDGQKGNAAKALFDSLLQSTAVPKFDSLPQEDVTVQGGTFRGCFVWKNEVTVLGIRAKSTTWTHPSLPWPSAVKTETNGYSSELVAFGLTGAKSLLHADGQ